MKICIWCKYGQEEGDRIKEATKIATMDCRKCPSCDRDCISGTFMVSKDA